MTTLTPGGQKLEDALVEAGAIERSSLLLPKQVLAFNTAATTLTLDAKPASEITEGLREALVTADLQLGDGHVEAARRTLHAAMDGTALARPDHREQAAAGVGDAPPSLTNADRLRITACYHRDKLPSGLADELLGLADEWSEEVAALTQPKHPPEAAAPSGSVGGALDECMSHYEAWRSALTFAECHAKVEPPEVDDRLYWQYEIHAFDQTFAALRALAQQPAPQAPSETVAPGIFEALKELTEAANDLLNSLPGHWHDDATIRLTDAANDARKAVAAAGKSEPLAPLVEPARDTEERAFWLEAAIQHGFEEILQRSPGYFGDEDVLIRLMFEARKQGRADVLNRPAPEVSEVPRSAEEIQTFTGLKFCPMKPNLEAMNIEDIAHALSLQTRFGGHCLNFYSIAEHCVLMARSVPKEDRLWALLHDGSEAYLTDVVRPVKRHLKGYAEAEHRLMAGVAKRFGLVGDMPASVKEADCRILIDERAQNMHPTEEEWHYGGATEPLGVTLQFWTPEEAESAFLALYAEITGLPVKMPVLTPPQAARLGDGVLAEIAAERRRQIEAEGWTPAHDDTHAGGEMALAAGCYALAAAGNPYSWLSQFWPWSRDWWKPGTPRRMLVKSGALIVAEIERRDRVAPVQADAAEGRS